MLGAYLAIADIKVCRSIPKLVKSKLKWVAIKGTWTEIWGDSKRSEVENKQEVYDSLLHFSSLIQINLIVD